MIHAILLSAFLVFQYNSIDETLDGSQQRRIIQDKENFFKGFQPTDQIEITVDFIESGSLTDGPLSLGGDLEFYVDAVLTWNNWIVASEDSTKIKIHPWRGLNRIKQKKIIIPVSTLVKHADSFRGVLGFMRKPQGFRLALNLIESDFLIGIFWGTKDFDLQDLLKQKDRRLSFFIPGRHWMFPNVTLFAMGTITLLRKDIDQENSIEK